MRTLIYLLLAFAFVACSKKKVEPQEEQSTPTGKLHLLLGSVYKAGGEYQDFVMFPDTGLSSQSISYGTASSDLVIFSEFRYFVHHVVLFKASGDSIPLKDSIFVVRNTPEYRLDNTLVNLPEGTYTKISFEIGAVEGNAVAALKKKAPEFFRNDDSYDFLYFRGLYQNKDTAAAFPSMPARAWKKVEWSLATPSNPAEQFSRKVTCPLFAPIEVSNAKTPLYLHVRVNILGLFGFADQVTSHLIDIKSMPKGRFTKATDLVYENLFVHDPAGTNQMFVNDHIHPN